MISQNSVLFLGILLVTINKVAESFNTPSFVSNWTYMDANGYKAVNFTHNMNSLPVMVEVQVKATDGPNKDFIFPGTSSTQNDDDHLELRGGVIYIYNENEIILFSAIGLNSRLIYTGSPVNRIGPNTQSSMSGQVRAKIWNACDFPKPDFSFSWFDIATHDASNPPFKEINHNLDVHPVYVLVQVQILEGSFAGYYFDGTGTCMVDSTYMWLNHAGVLFAYNETTVRLWMPTAINGYLFGLVDGWGTYNDQVYGEYKTNTNKGKARILAWRSIGKPVMESVIPYGYGVTNEDFEIAINREDFSKEVFVSVEAQARDGVNENYRFSGTGAAMEDPINDGNFGGIVYSFNQTSVRIWRPNDSNNKGFLSFVGNFWGGFYPQASNAADIVIKVWEVQKHDESDCASGACLLTGKSRCNCCAPSPDMCSDPHRETKMGVKDSDQRPPDSTSIQRATLSSVVQCSNMCLYDNDCVLISFNNDQCILYKQTAIGSTYIIDLGVEVWGKI